MSPAVEPAEVVLMDSLKQFAKPKAEKQSCTYSIMASDRDIWCLIGIPAACASLCVHCGSPPCVTNLRFLCVSIAKHDSLMHATVFLLAAGSKQLTCTAPL